MIAGRKLLLADDSPAIQKIVDLTFTDEGMEVTTVSNGRDAISSLDQTTPDVILADVFMPGIGGYELCEYVKRNERFNQIPVILLVGSFEPFDETEARRVGADDVVSKPFQSIRQLVGRVGSLFGGKPPARPEAKPTYATSAPVKSTPPPAEPAPANLKVMVEAPSMIEIDEPEIAEKTCTPDIELQTADTIKLDRVDVPPSNNHAAPSSRLHDDTIETEAVVPQSGTFASAPPAFISESSTPGVREMNSNSSPNLSSPSTDPFGDALLDLDDVRTPAPVVEESILDLDDTAPSFSAPAAAVSASAPVAAVAGSAYQPSAPREMQADPFANTREWAVSEPVVKAAEAAAGQVNLSNLSPEVIDAIARRAVELMSEKVIREIAWEVVPELAELLIKQKLNEK